MRSYLHNPKYIGQVIRRKGNVRIIMTGKFKHINKNEAFNVKKLWKEK